MPTADDVDLGYAYTLKPEEAITYFESKGYVIGGYACPLCTAFQEKIDFEEYDFVCVRYRICKDAVIPFYNFYKRIEGDTYALTSVPAIEIEGYAEHFEKVQSNHEHKTQ